MNELCLLTADGSFKHKVSTILNGSSEYSGKHMFDGQLHTCWNSDQGEEQYIVMDFGRTVTVGKCDIMFQGGFVGQYCKIDGGSSMSSLQEIKQLHHIQDANELQEFAIDSTEPIRYLKITFKDFSDFYGRLIIYKLDIYGNVIS